MSILCKTNKNNSTIEEYKAKLEGYKAKLEGYKAKLQEYKNLQLYVDELNTLEVESRTSLLNNVFPPAI